MAAGSYLDDRLLQVVELWGATRVLKRLGVQEAPTEPDEAACKGLSDLATSRKLPSPATREAADCLALDVLDGCATLGDNPGAELAGRVAEAIGTKVGSMAFDSGGPGSGQVLQAWRVRNDIVVTGGEIGAFAVCDDVDDLLAWWVGEWEHPEIDCPGVKVSAIKALGLVATNDPQRELRINGRWWRRRKPARGV
jgi:hypothetical protein